MTHYNAFISYNHNPRDNKIVATLQRQLENYRIPKEIRASTGVAKIERVFLDKGELEVAGDLNKVICDALENTDYLIVICSPESKKSIWVQREIEYFLRNHSIDNILTVITAGEPNDVLPEILFHGEPGALTQEQSATDGTATDGPAPETEGQPGLAREPLSCDYRLPPRVARNVELPRLVAALIGCRYDDLVQRQRHYRMRRLTIAMSAALVVLLSAVSYLIWSNDQIKTSLETSLVEQSRNLSVQSEQALGAGDRISALQYAVDALPAEENDRPVVAEAIHALSRALNLYKTSSLYSENAIRRYPSYGNRHIRLATCSGKGRSFMAELYNNGRFALWDADTGKELLPDYSAGLMKEDKPVQNLTFTEDGKLILITGDSIRVIDLIGENEIKSIPIDGEYFKIFDYSEFKTSCDDLVIKDHELWIPVATVSNPEENSKLKVRHNSLEIVDAIASLARDSDDGDELVLNIRRNMVSEIDYRIMKIDLDTGKTLAETPAPRRPVKIRMSPDGNYLACHYTSYYDLQRDEEDDQVVIMKAEDLSTVGSIGREFVSDLCFDRSDRILICGFGQKPAQGDKAVYGKVDFIDNGSRSLFAFSQDRELVLSCYDAESCGEVWSREAKINAGGTPWLRITSENDALSNAIICTLGNSLFITDAEGEEIGSLHALSSVVEEGSNDIGLVTVLDDGGMTSWTYDHEHGFKSTTRYNTLLGPVIKYAEAGNHSFAISTDSESNAYKEILTQYQSDDCDPKWEAYEYNKAADSQASMGLIDADYYKDSFVEIRSELTGDRRDDLDKKTEIIVRDIGSGSILTEHELVASSLREDSADEPQYTEFLYSGLDRERGKAYFLDNNSYLELTLMSVDLEDGTEEKIPLKMKLAGGEEIDPDQPALYDIASPVDLYSAYLGTAGIYSIDDGYIYYPAFEGAYHVQEGRYMVRLVVLKADPETGETTVSGIMDLADDFDTSMYAMVRLNAACGRFVCYENARLTCYDLGGKVIWTGDELTYEPAGFTITDDGDVISLEKTGTEAELHIYSKVDGRETASSELGAAVLLSYEKLSCEELSGDERMVVVGDDAYLLDSKTWELRTAINDNFITYSPAAGQFMLGDADEKLTGHAPYRTLKEMIDEAGAVLE